MKKILKALGIGVIAVAIVGAFSAILIFAIRFAESRWGETGAAGIILLLVFLAATITSYFILDII